MGEDQRPVQQRGDSRQHMDNQVVMHDILRVQRLGHERPGMERTGIYGRRDLLVRQT
ncbi:hypothetical protein I553_4578 [Mycobacterium xenopi 4042]|uniref:Uncharacterized protein n=1 Tax=Mycobacterium xenopi 4042 TaxID=1299334 RepID=X8AGR7_MYCXE|nr:hypothetical protein I553_4578 [Mycobacterium xenopi 4042]